MVVIIWMLILFTGCARMECFRMRTDFAPLTAKPGTDVLLTTKEIDRPYREIGVIFVKGRHARYEKIVEKLRSEAKELEADAVIKIENYVYAVRQYTQAALRDTTGTMELDQVLTERDRIAEDIREIVDKETNEWGIDIKAIKIQELELPAEMKRAFAMQAEAEREKRAIIIKAEGEMIAAAKFAAAAKEMATAPGSLQLRTLQTIRDIAQDPSEKIIIFMPNDLTDVASKVIRRASKK